MSCLRNQNGNQTKLQIGIIQREHNQVDNSYPKVGHVKLQREFKVTVLSVNRFACASWYSMNGQNDEFQTGISCHKILTICTATRDQPTVHKESQPVPGIKIESYILATFLNTMTFSGEIMQKSLTTY